LVMVFGIAAMTGIAAVLLRERKSENGLK
jgi:hypothetical protein